MLYTLKLSIKMIKNKIHLAKYISKDYHSDMFKLNKLLNLKMQV